MAQSSRNLARELKRDVRVLQQKLGNLEFFTEDFRENNLQIYTRVLTNLDLLNLEVERVASYQRRIVDLEEKVLRMDGTLGALCGILGNGLTAFQHRNGSKDASAQTTPRVNWVPVAAKKKDAAIQTTQIGTYQEVATQSSFRHADIEVAVQTSPTEGRDSLSCPPPTERMLVERGKPSHYLREPTLLCCSCGKVEWVPLHDKWKQFIEHDSFRLYSPDIILPMTLGGAKVVMQLWKYDGEIWLWTWLRRDAYNKYPSLPLYAHVGVEVAREKSEIVMCVGEGDVAWLRLGETGEFLVCQFREGQFEDDPPRFQFSFDSPC